MQGESSLVVATDTANGAARGLLIDGGHSVYGHEINTYIASFGVPVQAIVASHFDADHSGGLRMLLAADNLSVAATTVADVVTPFAVAGFTRPQLVAGCTAAAYMA